MTVLVVSGTGTGVGKTTVTAALAALAAARGASVAVVKPAQTGAGPDDPGDLEAVRRLAGVGDLHEHARFAAALAPAAAARVAGQAPVDLRVSCAAMQELAEHRRLVLVEGAGGLLVRYDEDGTTIADLARWLHAPVLVVAAPALGTLNATALTLEALAHRGLGLAGIVLGCWPEHPGLAERACLRDLETLAARPLAGALPAGAGSLSAAEFLTVAHVGLGPSLGGTFDAADFRRRFDPVPQGGLGT